MTEVLGVALPREHDPRATLLAAEVVNGVPERALEDVVGEHHADAVSCNEPLGEPQRFRDPALLLLVRVEQAPDAVRAAVAEQPEELAGMRPPVTSITSVMPARTSASI